MKKLILLFIIVLVGCSGVHSDIKKEIEHTQFYYFGVNSRMVKEANYWKVGAGALASIGVHIGAHYAYAGVSGMSVRQEGFFEVFDGDCNPRQKREFSQAGLFAQNIVGLVLTSIPATRQSDFTKGYVLVSFIETAFYPVLWRGESGDLYQSNKYGGNADLEYAIFTAVATHNMLRVNWRKD